MMPHLPCRRRTLPKDTVPMLKHLLQAWLRFAQTLARINSYLMLTLVFVLAVIPIGVLFRLFGRSIARALPGGSRWVERESDHDPERPF